MAVEVLMLTLGVVHTNCFIVGDTEAKTAVVIDPADDAARILGAIHEREWTVKAILATHAHFDHVLAVGELQAAIGAPFRLHELDLPLLRAMQATAQLFGLNVPPPPEPDGFVNEGERFVVDDIALDVLLTPGHAPGHVSYVMAEQRIVFSGDCLFEGSIGRTDLPGSDYETLMQSIFEKLLPLGDEFTVAAGHSGLTTIGRERHSNPFLLSHARAVQD